MTGTIYIHIMWSPSSLKMSIESHNLLKCICFLKMASTLLVKLSYWPHNVWIGNSQNSAIITETSKVKLSNIDVHHTFQITHIRIDGIIFQIISSLNCKLSLRKGWTNCIWGKMCSQLHFNIGVNKVLHQKFLAKFGVSYRKKTIFHMWLIVLLPVCTTLHKMGVSSNCAPLHLQVESQKHCRWDCIGSQLVIGMAM